MRVDFVFETNEIYTASIIKRGHLFWAICQEMYGTGRTPGEAIDQMKIGMKRNFLKLRGQYAIRINPHHQPS